MIVSEKMSARPESRAARRLRELRGYAVASGAGDRGDVAKRRQNSHEFCYGVTAQLTEAGIEPAVVTALSHNDLRHKAKELLPESMPDGVVLPPDVWDRLPESLRASITASILDIERGDAM